MLHVLTPESFQDPRAAARRAGRLPRRRLRARRLRDLDAAAVPAGAGDAGRRDSGRRVADARRDGGRAAARDRGRDLLRAPARGPSARACSRCSRRSSCARRSTSSASWSSCSSRRRSARPLPVFLVTVNTYAGLTDDPVAWLRALLVPWLIAGLPLAAMCLRMVRATLPEILAQDFVRTATAKGVTPRRITLLAHAAGRPARDDLARRRLRPDPDRQRDPRRGRVRHPGHLPADPERGRPAQLPGAAGDRDRRRDPRRRLQRARRHRCWPRWTRACGSPAERAAVAEEAAGRAVVGQFGGPHDPRRALARPAARPGPCRCPSSPGRSR